MSIDIATVIEDDHEYLDDDALMDELNDYSKLKK